MICDWNPTTTGHPCRRWVTGQGFCWEHPPEAMMPPRDEPDRRAAYLLGALQALRKVPASSSESARVGYRRSMQQTRFALHS